MDTLAHGIYGPRCSAARGWPADCGPGGCPGKKIAFDWTFWRLWLRSPADIASIAFIHTVGAERERLSFSHPACLRVCALQLTHSLIVAFIGLALFVFSGSP